MKIRRFLGILAAFVAIGNLGYGAAADANGAAHVIVAKDSRDPVLIWQASREVYTMVGDGASENDINAQLSHDALKAAAVSLKKVSSTNGLLTLKIMYNKMTADGLNYQVFTLSNASEYAEVQMQIKDARRNRDKWTNLPAHAKIPAWIHFKVVGKLPGR